MQDSNLADNFIRKLRINPIRGEILRGCRKCRYIGPQSFPEVFPGDLVHSRRSTSKCSSSVFLQLPTLANFYGSLPWEFLLHLFFLSSSVSVLIGKIFNIAVALHFLFLLFRFFLTFLVRRFQNPRIVTLWTLRIRLNPSCDWRNRHPLKRRGHPLNVSTNRMLKGHTRTHEISGFYSLQYKSVVAVAQHSKKGHPPRRNQVVFRNKG